MKRKSNGLIVGTVLVVLIGALIVLQARNVEPPEHDELPPPTSDTPGGNYLPAPSVDEALDKPGPTPNTAPPPQ
jgi:hypothetical protein